MRACASACCWRGRWASGLFGTARCSLLHQGVKGWNQGGTPVVRRSGLVRSRGQTQAQDGTVVMFLKVLLFQMRCLLVQAVVQSSIFNV